MGTLAVERSRDLRGAGTTSARDGGSVRVMRRSGCDGPRRLTSVEMLVLMALVVALIAAALASRAPAADEVSTTTVRVEHGDTLWALARAHPAAGLSTEQTAELIGRMNGVDSEGLVAGCQVLVPSAPSGAALAAK